jgi:hypothetical protein
MWRSYAITADQLVKLPCELPVAAATLPQSPNYLGRHDRNMAVLDDVYRGRSPAVDLVIAQWPRTAAMPVVNRVSDTAAPADRR